MQESIQKIAVLYDASQAVLSTFDLDEVLNQILSIIHDYFQLHNGTVLLMDKARQDVYVRKQLGRNDDIIGHRIPLGQGIIGTAAKLKRPVMCRTSAKIGATSTGCRKPNLKWRFR